MAMQTSQPLLFIDFIPSLITFDILAKDREAYDCIHSWSIHVYDQGGRMQDIEKELLGFKQILKV